MNEITLHGDNAKGKESPIRVEVLRRSMYGKYIGKTYIFKNKRHMDAWVEKWFVKLGVDQFNVIGDDNQKQ